MQPAKLTAAAIETTIGRCSLAAGRILLLVKQGEARVNAERVAKIRTFHIDHFILATFAHTLYSTVFKGKSKIDRSK